MKWLTTKQLGQSLKTAENGWVNYRCPWCCDDKKEHFWVNPEHTYGECKKCNAKVRIHKVPGEASTAHLSGGITGLKEAITRTLSSFLSVKKEEPIVMAAKSGGLVYTTLDVNAIEAKWSSFNIFDVAGHVKSEIRAYCGLHNIYPIDLAKNYCKVLIEKSMQYEKFPMMWQNITDPSFILFFPIFRGGKLVGAYQRLFNIKGKDGVALGKWYNSGMGADGNGRLLFTSALPLWAFDGKDERLGRAPLVLVESPVDAIRLARIGWHSVALGGHDLPSKVKHELRYLPHKIVIVLLDHDATQHSIKIQDKVRNFKPGAYIGSIEKEGADPASLSDQELRLVLMKVVKEIQKATEKDKKEQEPQV